jgi:uncharacterized protein with HEPN domain
MTRDDLVYVGHMVEQARSIEAKVRGKSRAEFDADENLRLALTYLIQTIGESARRVSHEFRDAHPGVPWEKIVGMRNRVVHDYLYVDQDVVWVTATTRIPELVALLAPLVPGA